MMISLVVKEEEMKEKVGEKVKPTFSSLAWTWWWAWTWTLMDKEKEDGINRGVGAAVGAEPVVLMMGLGQIMSKVMGQVMTR